MVMVLESTHPQTIFVTPTLGYACAFQVFIDGSPFVLSNLLRLRATGRLGT